MPKTYKISAYETDASKVFSEAVCQVTYQHLPDPIVEIIKKDILDIMATSLAGSSAEGIENLLSLVRDWGGKDESTIWVLGDKVPSPLAALVNGMQSHALDYDDTYDAGPAHCGVCIVPAALAISERIGGVTGEELITAIAIGTEIMCRMSKAPHFRHGFSMTRTMGYFGAAATSAKLLCLSPEQTVHAFGLAFAQTTGEIQCVRDGALSKRLSVGLAAKGGLLSALMAQRGITGAQASLEGPFGLYNLHHRGEYDRHTLVSDLLEAWETSHLGFKAYPCCSQTHGAIDAALDVANRHTIFPDEVEKITLWLRSEEYYSTTCIPIEIKRTPRNTVDAQFSAPYTVASALIDRKVDIGTFTDESIKRKRIISLAQRIYPKLDHDVTVGSRTDTGARLEIALKNGNVLTGQATFRKGSPNNPMSPDDFYRKVCDCARHSAKAISDSDIDQLVSAIQNLEKLNDVDEITNYMALCK